MYPNSVYVQKKYELWFVGTPDGVKVYTSFEDMVSYLSDIAFEGVVMTSGLNIEGFQCVRPWDSYSRSVSDKTREYIRLWKTGGPIHGEEVARLPVEIGTDCSVAGGIKIWAWVSDRGSYNFGRLTNKRLSVQEVESMAILQALVSHRSYNPINVYSDSKLSVEEFNDEASNLRSRAPKGLECNVQWVKGHSNNKLNVAADQLATFVRRSVKQEIPTKMIRRDSRELVESILSRDDLVLEG